MGSTTLEHAEDTEVLCHGRVQLRRFPRARHVLFRYHGSHKDISEPPDAECMHFCLYVAHLR